MARSIAPCGRSDGHKAYPSYHLTIDAHLCRGVEPALRAHEAGGAILDMAAELLIVKLPIPEPPDSIVTYGYETVTTIG